MNEKWWERLYVPTVLVALLLACILLYYGLGRFLSGRPRGAPSPLPLAYPSNADPFRPGLSLSPPDRARFGRPDEKVSSAPISIPAPVIVDTVRAKPRPARKKRKPAAAR